MTPAVARLDAAGIPYALLSYDADAGRGPDVGVAAARALGIAAEAVFKTLVAELAHGELVVAVIPVAARLNLKRLARAAGAKSAALADPAVAERATGYVTGGISPFGQKKALRTFLAEEAATLNTIHVSAGKRGLELAVDPNDLIAVTDAVPCNLTG
ncbi:MAG: Cys-tRNA(Pro) deacylase [Pseudomonadales bacterium]